MDKETISYEDFAKLEIRIGTVKDAERVEGTDKLIKCTVDFGEFGERTIVSGIAQWKAPAELVGMQLPYIVNLEPRIIRGIKSEGMLMAVSFGEDGLSLLVPEGIVPSGASLS